MVGMRVALVLALAVTASAVPARGPALAQGTAAGAPMLRCPTIKDPMERLRCFDEAFPAAQPILAAPPPPPAAAAARPPLDPVATFGGSHLAPPEQKPADEITATLASSRMLSTGLVELTLDNGQVWRQIEAPGMIVPKKTRNLRIERGMIPGSFYLIFEGNPKKHSVRRVK